MHDRIRRYRPEKLPVVSALAVWTYADPAGARRLERCLSDGAVGDIAVTDGAMVTWTRGRASAQVRELQGMARTCSLGAFWAMLFGIVVSGPELTSMVGSSQPALDGSLEGVGVDRGLLVALRCRLRPGGSAVAAICDESVASDIGSASMAVARGAPHLSVPAVSTMRLLTSDQERALRRVFAV